MMTPSQCRAARALLDWTQPKLAGAATLGLSTIVDFEKQRRSISGDALNSIRAALEAQGVIFLPDGQCEVGGPGVRLRDRI